MRLVPCRCLRGEEEAVTSLDYSHCSLEHVPKEIFSFEKTLEELYLDANQIEELPKVRGPKCKHAYTHVMHTTNNCRAQHCPCMHTKAHLNDSSSITLRYAHYTLLQSTHYKNSTRLRISTRD